MEAISIEAVSKRFRLARDPVYSLKDRILRMGRTSYVDFWALKDIDLSIEQGETLGLLGHNGSGKSTLLKCVAGIMKPTTGQIRLRGRLASLLELGAGFHPDLSGRENVFINGAFLGIPRKEIDRRFDDIVAFAELEQFIDNQVKHYSSGMYVRLAFAVAVNVDPDVLLVDEVLAVGDEVFQKKCLDRIGEFQAEGRTIVIVTHATDLARRTCSRVAALHHGEMIANGSPGEAIRIYREHLHGLDDRVAPEPDSEEPRPRSRIRLTSVSVEHRHRADRPYVQAGEPASIVVSFDAHEVVSDAVFALSIFDERGQRIFSADTDALNVPLPPLHGSGQVVFEIAAVPLLDGAFPITVEVKDRHHGQLLDWQEQEQAIEVVNPTRATGIVAFPISVGVATGAVPLDADGERSRLGA
jgi:ABC-2 type transport system ATP-binding protein